MAMLPISQRLEGQHDCVPACLCRPLRQRLRTLATSLQLSRSGVMTTHQGFVTTPSLLHSVARYGQGAPALRRKLQERQSAVGSKAADVAATTLTLRTLTRNCCACRRAGIDPVAPPAAGNIGAAGIGQLAPKGPTAAQPPPAAPPRPRQAARAALGAVGNPQMIKNAVTRLCLPGARAAQGAP